jgi:ferredoxin-nitrite reductase
MVRAAEPIQEAKLNKFEKFKAEKDGLQVKTQIEEFARIGWEAMDKNDLEHRLKWLGVFWRPVTPGKLMMRMRIPNGILTSPQMHTLGEILQRYGNEGTADLTTRQNIQLRGIRIEDLPDIFDRLKAVNLTSVQSGMDNVRNVTGSPMAGLDADEIIDTRPFVQKVQDHITNNGEGNPEYTNLPRKFNIAIEGSRDNSVHAEINDIAFVPANKDGKLGFNIVVGGFFSASRCEAAIPLNAWIPADEDEVVDICRAILVVFRDNGSRANRQKSRLMWLIDQWGIETFRNKVETQLGRNLAAAASEDLIDWEKRDHIGTYKQQQADLHYVGMHVPVGKLNAKEMFDLARLAEVYGSGEIRLTLEQNVIIPNIASDKLDLFLVEPILQKFKVDPNNAERSVVSCTGAQFCNFALVETKEHAIEIAEKVHELVELPRPVRFHWTGCPNSCGQPQVAEIGFMGTKVRKDGKTVPGVDMFMGGRVGKDAHLGSCIKKGIAIEDLPEVLKEILIKDFGAVAK